MVVKQRSPNYPGFDLGAAVEAVHNLYPQVQRGEFTVLDAARAWNYNSASGPVRRLMGALRQYGLMEQKKGDNARLTSRAFTLVLRNQASNEYRTALRDAALEPTLFRELYESKRASGANDALRQYLVVERSFTDEGAARFIEVLRATFVLAGISGDDIMTRREEVITTRQEEEEMTPPPSSNKLVFSLSGGSASIKMELPLPLNEATWTQLTGMMNALKPALVSNQSEPEMQPLQSPNEEYSDSEDDEEGG